MSSALKTLLTGLITLVIGLALWLVGSDETVLILTPSKLGVVLIVVGALESLYGVYKTVRG
ncbi:DUF5708 family protein [Nonomuraea sp. GTA35]|uniref:DUF5708 family protein n=1 Tax=Nonomuraea sp. GTA35 TaxID=1676746 RepID=UPI0035BFBB0B